jgi:hypothetical protein
MILAPKTFLLTAILAWSGIVAAVWLMRTEEPALVIAQTEPPEFDMRWDDATVLKKQDRLPLAARPIPNPVERILRDVPVRVPPIVMSLEDKPATERRRHVARNVCTRHGKHKVIINGGRSWRCR